MAKEKKAKGSGSLPNKNAHLRLSFLYQAASYLASQPFEGTEQKGSQIHASGSCSPKDSKLHAAQTRHLLSHMKGVSRKSVIRLDRKVKQKVCKGCDQLLDEQSSDSVFENKSKGGTKPWADVLIVKCRNCGMARRFPDTHLTSSGMSQNGTSTEILVTRET